MFCIVLLKKCAICLQHAKCRDCITFRFDSSDDFADQAARKAQTVKLRGQLEVLNNGLENAQKRQRDMYLDLDTRLRRIEQQLHRARRVAELCVALEGVARLAGVERK